MDFASIAEIWPPLQIAVRLMAETGQLELTIADNGTGFDPALAAAGGKHFGLQIMSQRAERIGGQMAVHSAPGQGIRVEVRVPLAIGGTGSAA
jgi:signal transduction histidine kinase